MDAYAAGPFLSQIEHPADLRAKFKPEDLQQVSDELRQFIVDVVSEKGGHFGAVSYTHLTLPTTVFV